jgi:hypothetical protein
MEYRAVRVTGQADEGNPITPALNEVLDKWSAKGWTLHSQALTYLNHEASNFRLEIAILVFQREGRPETD